VSTSSPATDAPSTRCRLDAVAAARDREVEASRHLLPDRAAKSTRARSKTGALKRVRRAPGWDGAGKAAFHVAYVDDFADAPALADAAGGVGPDLDTLIKEWAPTTRLPVTRLAAEGPAR
jgi:hypothetical protein